MEAFWVSFGIFCFGIAMLGFGFNNRAQNSGVLMMWIGTLAILGLICYRIFVAIG
ncbi:hypothetical protein [Gallaecimonas pentaromativorans]|uniref:hypothetical protein n=1 Tax=Gallaecimonas pentaromativorans TaxID=584787 RepID=UPI003A937D35